ncbi:helicase C-terminal domain-containing protein [Infirmifilum sp. SLHALR2]
MSVQELFEKAGLKPRPGQAEVARLIASALSEGDVLLVAPTGWGKTLAVLAALKASRRLPALWLTRALEVGRRVVADASRLGLRAFVAAGRERLCPYARSVEDASEFCRAFRAQCPHFLSLVREGVGDIWAESWEELPKLLPGVCHYYAQDAIISRADVVVQNYHRRVSGYYSAAVVDEVHNLLAPRVRKLSAARLELALDELRTSEPELAGEAEEVLEKPSAEAALQLLDSVLPLYREKLKASRSHLAPLVQYLRAVADGGVPYREAGTVEVYMPPWRPRVEPRVYVSATIPEGLERLFGAQVVRVPQQPRKALVVTDLTSKYGSETIWGYVKLLATLRRRFARVLAFATERVARQIIAGVDFYEERLPAEWRGVALYTVYGRFSEGVDLSADAVVLLGAPFLPPEVEARYERYYNRLGISGEAARWVPMVTTTLQCVGRATRKPEDSPLIVLADYRFRRFDFSPTLVLEEVDLRNLEKIEGGGTNAKP